MDSISEYDERQLKLMHECLSSFEKNQIELSSLIGSLEFLLNAMESVDEEWENKFFKEATILESINAIEVMEESEKETLKFNKNESIELLSKAVLSLKSLIQNELGSQ
ncbi:MAG: hypothetical protein K1000chlam2_01499 [Chlamydiae bacterium]|nr:hypothetical protein [Chlamydiota bacterium]